MKQAIGFLIFCVVVLVGSFVFSKWMVDGVSENHHKIAVDTAESKVHTANIWLHNQQTVHETKPAVGREQIYTLYVSEYDKHTVDSIIEACGQILITPPPLSDMIKAFQAQNCEGLR